MEYADVQTTIEWLRCYANMLESGKAELEANKLDMTRDSIDMTTCDDNVMVFEPGDTHHTLTIQVRIGSNHV